MGFYFRKSISAGPFRFNLSGSGVGMSVGVKGFRVGTGPRGNYVHMGRGGLYYRASLGGRPHTARAAAPPRYAPTVPFADTTPMTVIEAGDVLDMAPSNGSDIVEQINEKLALLRIWPWVVVLGLLGAFSLLSHPGFEPFGAGLAIVTAAAAAVAVRFDQSRRSVVVMYDLADDAVALLTTFVGEFDKAANATRAWNIDTSGYTSDWKRNAGAGRLITRRSAWLGYNTPSVLKTNISVPCIKGGRQGLYFLPDVVLVVEGSQAGALSYDQLQIYWNTTIFLETDGVPSDSLVLGYSWQFVNKNGGPDRRFKNNRQIPRAQYQQMGIEGGGNLRKVLHLSKVEDRGPFDTALSNLRNMVRGLQHLALPAPGATSTAVPTPISSPSTKESWIAQNAIVVVLGTCILGLLALIGANLPPPSPANSGLDTQPPQETTAPPQATAVSPSFDCTTIHSQVLKLICATPDLAMADQELAAAYEVTLAKMHAKKHLRANEAAWIKRRNRVAPDTQTLLDMYHQRITYLRSLKR
jgi:uncharacterized protein YecT (DUF1311 family)